MTKSDDKTTCHCPPNLQNRHQKGCPHYKAPHDPVERPWHYTMGKIEVLDAIEDWRLGYHRGQVIKYVTRAGRKDPTKEVEDLKKARFYLDREITRLEQASSK